MTDGGGYPRVVLTCIILTLGVSSAIPNVLTLIPNDNKKLKIKVNARDAINHSGHLRNLVEDVEHFRGFFLQRVAENELRLFADYIATCDADDFGSIEIWARDKLPSFADRMRMLEAAQFFQMDALEKYIVSMEYTWKEIARMGNETQLSEATLHDIVEETPAYKVLRDADVTKHYMQEKENILKEIRTLLITGYGNIDLVNYGHFVDWRCNVLHWATKNRRPEVVELLLSIPGAVVTGMHKSVGDSSYSPLQIAAFDGSTRLVELLLRFPDIEVDAGAGTQLGTALHLTAAKFTDVSASDSTRIVELLIEHGANVNALDKKGNTALHIAAEFGMTGIIKVLLDNDADINHQNDRDKWTPLHVAVKMGQVVCMLMLIDNVNIDTSLKDSWGRTAYEYFQG